MTSKELERAESLFRQYFETILAWVHDATWSPHDKEIMESVEKHLEGKHFDRKKLALHYRQLERLLTPPKWDADPRIRDAILKAVGTTLEDYLYATGKKKYRSIDD